MAKLVALLATLLLAAHVTAAYRTTITTVETVESDDNPSRQQGGASQECRREMEQKDMNSCMRFLRERQQGGGGYESRGRHGGRDYKMCCDQLRSFDNERCMCEALEMEMGQMATMRQPEMMRTAQDLPRMCGAMSSPCEFHSRSF